MSTAKKYEKEQIHPDTSGINKDGTPDMRLKENRSDPDKVAEAAERQAEIQGVPEEGHNRDGTPDMRLKENRNNPALVAEMNQI